MLALTSSRAANEPDNAEVGEVWWWRSGGAREDGPAIPPPKSRRSPNKPSVEVSSINIATVMAASRTRTEAINTVVLDLGGLVWLLTLSEDAVKGI